MSFPRLTWRWKLIALDSSKLSFSTTFTLRKNSPTYYYDILGITPKATHKQIKAAFYKLSKDYHPDSADGSSTVDRFHEISEAYEVLGNHFKRKKYDRGLLNPTSPHSGHAASDNEVKDTTFRPQNFQRRGPIATGRTKYYNFDEYYKQHYGEHVKQQFKKRQKREHGSSSRGSRQFSQDTMKDLNLDRDSITQSPVPTALAALGLTFMFFYAVVMDTEFVRNLERSPVSEECDRK